MTDRPRYRNLPDGCAWDVWGPGDRLGTLNLLTPERVAAAATLVHTGRRFPLDLPVGVPDPPFFGRQPVRHETFHLLDHVIDDRLDSFFPQGSTQWDGFGHYGHTRRGFYGGLDAEAVRAGALGIEAWQQVGLAGRGVLLDVARHAAASGAPIPPDDVFVITPDALVATAEAQGLELREGDVWCVRTGWMAWYRSLDRSRSAELAADLATLRTPGLGPGPALAELLWDAGAAAIAVDNPAVEPMGSWDASADPNALVHPRVLAYLGLPLGEFFDFDALADDCVEDGVYEFLFTSAPLGIPGGVGSPPNALAIK